MTVLIQSLAAAIDSIESRRGRFCVAGRDAAKSFEPIDTALDEIAPLIRFPIIFNRCLAIGPRRDNGLDASVHQIVANFIAVVALVAEETQDSHREVPSAHHSL